jgi:hypothetical protein
MSEETVMSRAGRRPELRGMTKRSPFRNFKTNPEIVRLAVMLHACFPLSLRNVEDLLPERGIEYQPPDGPVLVEQIWADVPFTARGRKYICNYAQQAVCVERKCDWTAQRILVQHARAL